MYEVIQNFNQQFAFDPKIENKTNLKHLPRSKAGLPRSKAGQKKFVVIGMGGSHLAADLIKVWKPELDLIIHKNYGLPLPAEALAKEGRRTLFIASSYSGNTEEAIDGFRQALKKKLPLAAVSTGGKLLRLAKQHHVPYIQLPDTSIQPRSALGFSCKALLKLMGEAEGLKEISKLAQTLHPDRWEKQGKQLAKKIKNSIPIIYTSEKNYGIAYNWKIKFNETTKTPAFSNTFPELNHNEMSGFRSGRFHFIFLKDNQDHPKIKKRMGKTANLFRKRKFPVEEIVIDNKSAFNKIFSSIILADWTSYHLALYYKVDPEQIPMVEEFKKTIK